jgi:hypothetical protein
LVFIGSGSKSVVFPHSGYRRRLWLVVTPFLLAVLDHAVTLMWQPPGYWSGHYDRANEGNSVYARLLASHPAAFEAAMIAWIGIFVLLILVTPRRVALTIALAVSLGHAWGLSTWLGARLNSGYWWSLALFLATASLTVWCWDRFAESNHKD